jgi:SAM-dependent methyltransferase
MVAARVGLFEALAEGPADAEQIAERCNTDAVATERLVFALVGAGTLRPGRRAPEVALSRDARRYLLRRSSHEVVDKVLFAFEEWRVVEGYEAYVRRGEVVDLHAMLSAGSDSQMRLSPAPEGPTDGGEAWRSYQRGLRAVAGVSALEVAWRAPIPRGARQMLDIGGAHGRFAAAMLRRHPALVAEVLDLPEAVAASADLLAAEGLGPRLRHRVGDALEMQLGEGLDVVFASQFNHHLSDPQNGELARRVAASLRPGGVYIIQDLARPATPQQARQARLGALLDLYFGASSGAGTYSIETMKGWQRAAGLEPLPVLWLRTLPGLVQQAARKPRR